jgi:hypothetical protein
VWPHLLPFLFPLLSGHEVSSLSLLPALSMKLCLSINLKTVEPEDYGLEPLQP